MELQTLQVKTRQITSKGSNNQLRIQESVPGVLYGGKNAPVNLVANLKQFSALVHGKGGEHAIVKLEFEDDATLNSAALLKAVQHGKLRGEVLHADFMRISLDERITTMVPVHVKGQPRGVVDGGVLDHQLREVEVECLALEVPEEIVVDITNLGLGDSLHVGDLTISANVTIITEADRVIAAIHAPRAAKEAGEGDEDASAGPEVITERKKESKE